MQPKNRALNIAHRGARSLAPENTILAARRAVAVGADMWELDVAMTADGELVVIHDDTLERTSNAAEIYPDRAPWQVHTFTLEELRALDFGAWFAAKDPFGQIAAHSVTAAELERFSAVPIPTLAEALDFTREYRFKVNVEIKDLTGKPGDGQVVEKVVALIDQRNMAGQTMISSFNHEYIVRSRAANTGLPTAALIESPVSDPLALLQRTGAVALNPSLELAAPELVSAAREAGYDVYVWTVNEEADMRAMLAANVSGLFTDFPQRLHAILNERK
jgi:glycerophosphoryl diester phosphodiesterase